jgi:hypothetical protein
MDAILAAVLAKQYSHVTRQCRKLETQVHILLIRLTQVLQSNPNPTFYSIFILGYLFQNELSPQPFRG